MQTKHVHGHSISEGGKQNTWKCILYMALINVYSSRAQNKMFNQYSTSVFSPLNLN